MVWVVILVSIIVTSGVALSYNLGKRDGIEQAYQDMNMVIEVLVEMIQQQQQGKESLDIFEEFK